MIWKIRVRNSCGVLLREGVGERGRVSEGSKGIDIEEDGDVK